MQTQPRTLCSIILLTLVWWLATVQVAAAADKTVSDTIGPQHTNWRDTLAVDKFDPAEGTLRNVDITLAGTIDGAAKYESNDAQAKTVTLNLAANIQLQRPNNGQILQAAPTLQKVDNATAFDGLVDFDGTSGGTFPDLAATTSDHIVLTAPADLVLFTGSGQILLPVQATGASRAIGSGNVVAEFMVNAQATITVKYTYEPATTPKIRLQKSVYAGHTGGAGCPGQDLLAGHVGDPITYCFDIKNTGNTYLNAVTLVDADLGIDRSKMSLAQGNPSVPLAPGAHLLYYYETQLTKNLLNTAVTTGTPSDNQGNSLGLPPVTDDDTAQVVIAIQATITACKEDSNGQRLSGWKIKLKGPAAQSGVTGADGCITFTVNLPGDYKISEVQQAGWTQLTPVDNGRYTVKVQPDGNYGPFVFVNFHLATIRSCKVDDRTGAPLPNWELNLHGPENQSLLTGDDGCVTFQVGQVGDYTLSETQQAGWTQVAPANTYAVRGVSAGGSYGQHNEYTFRNRAAGSITIVKQAAPQDGTDFHFTGDLGDFTLDDAASDDGDAFHNQLIWNALAPGAYQISETSLAGWTLAGFTCISNLGRNTAELTDTTAHLSLAPGEQLTCTFVNRQQPVVEKAQLTVIKLVENSFGGVAAPSDFTINVNGGNPTLATFPGSASGVTVTLEAGPYSVTEQPAPGYTGEFSDECAGVINLGEHKVCTIVNRQTIDQPVAHIMLIKAVINDGGGTASPNDFGLTVGNVPVASGQMITVTPNLAYAFHEIQLKNYEFVSLTGEGCPQELGAPITPQPGADLVCTITNRFTGRSEEVATAELGDLVWIDTNHDGIQNEGINSGLAGITVKLYHADGTFTGLTSTTDATGQYRFEALEPGDYFVEFVVPTDYHFTTPDRIERGLGDEHTDSDADAKSGRTAVITLHAHEANRDIDAGLIAPTGLPDSAEPKAQQFIYLPTVSKP